ncbi:cation:proton antiporter [Patescibacteria group bacterium]|nr:cation:proton antiporter [Patescibacteria group bacterium]
MKRITRLWKTQGLEPPVSPNTNNPHSLYDYREVAKAGAANMSSANLQKIQTTIKTIMSSFTEKKSSLWGQMFLLAAVATGILVMSEHGFALASFSYMAVILFALYGITDVLQKAKMLPILAQLVAGIIVINICWLLSASKIVNANPVIEFFQKSHFWHYIGEFVGLSLLFYKAGLETNIVSVKQVGARAVLLALLGMVFVGGLAYLGLMPFGLKPIQTAFIIVGLVPTSAGVPMLVFAAKNMSKALVATFILVAAIADDILSLVLLSVLDGASSGSVDAVAILGKVGITIGFLAIGGLIGYLANKTFLYKIFHNVQSHNSVLIITLLWGTVFGVIAYFLGVNTVIGTYTAGLFLQKARYDEGNKTEELEHLVAPLTNLFAPIFFMWVGGQFIVANITGYSIGLAGVLLVCLSVGKYIAAKMTVIGSDQQTKEMESALCFGMFARVEVSLIIVSMGIASGILSKEITTSLILVVMISVLVTITGISKWISKNHLKK